MIFSVFKNFSKDFCEYIRMENPSYKKENIETKHFNNTRKITLVELEKDFIELKDRELKGREVKIKGEIEELVFKPIIVSIDDMDKFEQKKRRK